MDLVKHEHDVLVVGAGGQDYVHQWVYHNQIFQ